MKNLKYLSILLLVTTLSSFKSIESKWNYKSYYYVSAPILKHNLSINRFVKTGEVYISTLQIKNHSKACGFSNHTTSGLKNQFRDFIEANYNVKIGDISASIFDSNTFSKSKAIEYYRKTKKRFDKVKTLHNFEYYCDDE